METNTKPSYLHSLLLHLFIYFSFLDHLSQAQDTLLLGRVLSGDQTISSKSEVFELGLFRPSGTSQNYYLGIWYKQISEKNVVWVANREKPLSNFKNSQLMVALDGNLVLFDEMKERVWSTNVDSIATNSTYAVLLDNGNLVLKDSSHPYSVIWQSFDHPTDTWLPGAEIGRNKITGERQRLVAWRSFEDPAPGLFSLEIDPNGTNQYVLLWNASIAYWTSGVWNGEAFPGVPEIIHELNAKAIANLSFVATANRSYFTYNFFDSSLRTRNILEPSGQVKQCMWFSSLKRWNCFWIKPRDKCDVYSVCGAFSICTEEKVPLCSCLPGFEPKSVKDWNAGNSLGGCMRKSELQCNLNSSVGQQEDGFWILHKVRLPANKKLLTTVRSAVECEVSCLSSCSCIAYAYHDECLVWNGNLVYLRQLSNDDHVGQDLHVRLSASQLKTLGPKKRRISMATVGAIIGAALALFVITLLWIWRCRRQQEKISLEIDHGCLVSFSYRYLQILTKNFSKMLGRGSFGSVYRGTLADSTSIAVKKLEGHIQGDKQFRTEVSSIGKIQHINLIRLLGFCSQGNNRLLVYEYMPNGSLDTHLFHKNIHASIDWNIRYRIAIGSAKGLAYLHEECRDFIIHCDIKPENILLDAEFCPKVSDFGMAKLVGRDFSRVLTSMRGTIGYLAPEWISGVAITPKADVYSYGMMLFEIISGKRNTEQLGDGESLYFPFWASQKIVEGEVLCLLDYRLVGNANLEELVRASRVACWCIQDNENDRPTMGQVVQMLEGVVDVKLPPIPSSIKYLFESTP